MSDRDLFFGDVVVRVNPNVRLALHLDPDKGNAANVTTGMVGYVDGIQSGWRVRSGVSWEVATLTGFEPVLPP